MKRLIIISLCLLGLVISVHAGKVDEDLYHYEVDAYDGGVSVSPGFIIMKVWSYGKKGVLTNDYCMRNAVHAILFKGCPGVGSNAGVNALVPEGYEAHKKFFDDFFKGKYLQYVQLTNHGMRDAGDIYKLKGNRYKVGTIVMINLKGLRKYLESENIIKPLDFLFD